MKRACAALVLVLLLVFTLGIGSQPVAAAIGPGTYRSAVFVSKTSSKVTVLVGDARKDINVQPTAQVLVGNFDSDATTATAFLYNPGPAADGMLTWRIVDGAIVTSFTADPVGGTYRPFVLDYDEAGNDDIFWYAPGTKADYVWAYTGAGAHAMVTEHVTGTFTPIPVRSQFYGGDTDPPPGIVWYAPGTAPDYLWFRRTGPPTPGSDPWNRNITVTINGYYRPVLGTFVQRDWYDGGDILWYSADGPEYVWTFGTQPGSHYSYRIGDIAGGARPVVGRYRTFTPQPEPPSEQLDTVLWYFPGTAHEQYWVPRPLDPAHPSTPPRVDSYEAGSVTGDYRPLAWGPNDVFFLGPGTTAKLSHFTANGLTGTITITNLPRGPIGATTTLLVN